MELYKKGQGNRARALVAVAAGLLVVFGVAEVFGTLLAPANYIVSALIVILIGGSGIFLSFFYKKTADFLIDTEAEMKKVAWPPWGEVKGSATVVISTVIVMALFLAGLDSLLALVVQWMGIFPKV